MKMQPSNGLNWREKLWRWLLDVYVEEGTEPGWFLLQIFKVLFPLRWFRYRAYSSGYNPMTDTWEIYGMTLDHRFLHYLVEGDLDRLWKITKREGDTVELQLIPDEAGEFVKECRDDLERRLELRKRYGRYVYNFMPLREVIAMERIVGWRENDE